MTTQARFLAKIKPGCFLIYKQLGILPSIVAAQTIIESGWGQSTLASTYNNFWGIKSFNSSEPRVLMTTQEDDGRGGKYYIRAYFRTYTSIEAGFKEGYFKVISQPRYAKARGEKNARMAITYIKQGGYATDSSYVNQVMSVVEANKLLQWDKEAIAGGDGGYFGASDFYTFNTKPIEKNRYSRPGFPLKGVVGIVLHDAGSDGASLSAVRSNLEKGNGGREFGYHILIDSKDTECVVPLTEAVYHTNTKELRIPTLNASSKEMPNGGANLTTLSIGICRTRDGKFANETSARVIAVVSELLNHYNLPIESVYRALDVDASLDPMPYYANYADYSTLLGLIKYQRNQDTPLMNEDLIKLIEEEQAMEDTGGGGGAPMGQEVINSVSGTRQRILALAFEMKTWGLTYSQSRRNKIYKNGYSDCSSFTQYVYRHAAGIDIGINTWAQWARGVQVQRKNTLPGDLAHWYEHVGILTTKGGDWVIHSGVGNSGFTYATDSIRQSRDSIQHMRTDYMGLRLKGYRRYVSESGDTSSGSAGNTGGINMGGTSSLDTSKQYYLDIKTSINTYNADSNKSTSIKRLAKGSTVKVLSIGAFAYRVGEGEWVRKSDSANYELRGTDKKTTPIGEARIIGYAEAKSQPSLASSSVLEQGRTKVYDRDEVLPVYGMRNGLILVTPPDLPPEYISVMSTEFTSNLSSFPVYSDREDEEALENLTGGKTVSVMAVVPKEEYDSQTGRLTIPGTVATNIKTFPAGATLSLDVPSYKSASGNYYIGGSHDLGEDVVILYVETAAEAVAFAKRIGTARITSFGV